MVEKARSTAGPDVLNTRDDRPRTDGNDEIVDTEANSLTLPLAGPQTRYDIQILQSLRQIIHAVDVYSRKLRTLHRITAPQLVCLQAVTEHGSLTATQIAERVHLTPSTVVGILDRLQARDLINRSRDTRDRRFVNVSATAEGRQLIDTAPSPLQDSLADALQGLPELEQATIALSLRRVADLMNVRSTNAPFILETGSRTGTMPPSPPEIPEPVSAGVPQGREDGHGETG